MALYIPMFLHMLLCVALYTMLTLARAPRIWGLGQTSSKQSFLAALELKINANLANQFEWPMFFYVICLVLICTRTTTAAGDNQVYLYLAWLFIAGRVVHSAVQIFSNNVRLRGIVFSVSFVAVIAMWVLFALESAKLY